MRHAYPAVIRKGIDTDDVKFILIAVKRRVAEQYLLDLARIVLPLVTLVIRITFGQT